MEETQGARETQLPKDSKNEQRRQNMLIRTIKTDKAILLLSSQGHPDKQDSEKGEASTDRRASQASGSQLLTLRNPTFASMDSLPSSPVCPRKKARVPSKCPSKPSQEQRNIDSCLASVRGF